MFRFALYLCLCSQVVTCASSLSANQRDLCGNAMIVRNSNEIVKNDQGELVVGLDQLGDDSFLVPPGKQLVGESDSSFKLREFKFRGYTRAKFVMVMAQSLQNESFFGVLKPNGTVVNDLESFAEGMIPWHHFNSETISEIDRRLKNDFPYEWYAVPREIAAKRSIETLEAYVNAASIYGFEKPGIILGPSYRGEGRPSLEQLARRAKIRRATIAGGEFGEFSAALRNRGFSTLQDIYDDTNRFRHEASVAGMTEELVNLVIQELEKH